ncbi:MAG: CoA transferase [Bacteroidota bacterium]
MPPTSPLQGQTIIELARPGGSEVTNRAISLAGRIAADLGATVVKVEPPEGCALRRAAPFVTGADGARESATFAFLNGGKRSLRLGGRPQDQALIAALAARAQATITDDTAAIAGALARVPVKVIVEHGVPASAGLPEERITDTTILALSGLLDIMGKPDAAPVPLGGHQASYVTGLAAFSALCASLSARAQGAAGETATVSAVEANLWSNWKSFAERLYLGRCPTRQGELAEWQTVPCADGYATLIYLEKDWPAVARLIGEPRLAAPPLDTREGRRANIAQVYDMVRPWYAARSRKEIYALAKAAGLPIGAVIGVRELLDDQQYAAQRFLAPSAARNRAEHWRVPTVPTAWSGQRFAPSVATQGTDATEAVL